MTGARRIAIGLVAGAVAGLMAGAAQGAPRIWHAPVAIAPQGTVFGARPAVALASRGEALAAWRSHSRGRDRVEVRVRHGLRAPWSAPDVLADRAAPAGSAFADPAAAMNARGDAVLLWQVAGGPLRAAVRRGWSGRWRTATVPAPPAGVDPAAAFATPRLAVAPDGGAVALWTAQQAGAWVVRGARLARGSATWRETPPPPLDPGLPPPPRSRPPQIALAGSGDAVALWTAPSAGGLALRAARRAGAGPWGAAATLADPVAAAGRPAVSAAGRAVATWTGAGPTPPSAVVVAEGAPGAAGFGAPETLPASASATAAAIDPRGGVLVAWSGSDDGEAHAAVRPAGGAWGATMRAQGGILPLTGYEGTPVALDRAGTAHVGVAFAVPGAQVHEWPFSVVTGTAAAWAGPRRIAAGDTAAALATAPDGTAVVLSRGEPGTIWAAGYDGLPDVRVTARVRGRVAVGGRAVRWTVRVRNAGRIAAQGVRVRLRPRPGRTSLRRLGRLTPGATRTIVTVARLRGGEDGASLWATVFAAATPPVSTRGEVRVPAGPPGARLAATGGVCANSRTAS